MKPLNPLLENGEPMRSTDRPAFTAREAKACCTCRHWEPESGLRGVCRHPQEFMSRLEFENPETKERTMGRLLTGCYATCALYEEKAA